MWTACLKRGRPHRARASFAFRKFPSNKPIFPPHELLRSLVGTSGCREDRHGIHAYSPLSLSRELLQHYSSTKCPLFPLTPFFAGNGNAIVQTFPHTSPVLTRWRNSCIPPLLSPVCFSSSVYVRSIHLPLFPYEVGDGVLLRLPSKAARRSSHSPQFPLLPPLLSLGE